MHHIQLLLIIIFFTFSSCGNDSTESNNATDNSATTATNNATKQTINNTTSQTNNQSNNQVSTHTTAASNSSHNPNPADYTPPIIQAATRFNRDYFDKMRAEGKPTQNTPWGFQEIMLDQKIEHHLSSTQEYINLVKQETSGANWKDGKTHIIHFAAGTYDIPSIDSYFVLYVPSRTIFQGAGIGKTIFRVKSKPTYSSGTSIFSLENSSDVALRNFSFYNETPDNQWRLFYVVNHNASDVSENFLFENIEFDDAFGAIGSNKAPFNFITLRGLRKRIGNTTARIKQHYDVPVPTGYQFRANNSDNVQLAGQVGIRTGNSTVVHDCILGDNISATIDTYNNYIEIVGTQFIDPLHDHSIKMPHGNHLYIHDSTFELRYAETIIDGGAYWNPTFYTHEGFASGNGFPNYHFANLKFKRVGQIVNIQHGTQTRQPLEESEPFMLYNNRIANVSGDMVWESISFEGYTQKIVGYPDVQINKGFQAINYTTFDAKPALMKQGASKDRGDFSVQVDTRPNGSSKTDITGVYSWGQKKDGTIDFPRDNRAFSGSKTDLEKEPYVRMKKATVQAEYNARL